jgi:CRISPR-associated protein Csh2
LKNLLNKLDIRLFGATFAPKGADNMNISIHGPVQISYGMNQFQKLKDSGMYTDQIGSPYASKKGADQTTLGSQTRSQEAHYVHHFSINPKNLSSYVNQFNNGEQKEDNDKGKTNDIKLLKEAMAVATTYYDSTSKKDSENELLLWIELNENSEKIMKNFTELIKISNADDGKTKIDFEEVFHYLNKFSDNIANIDIYYDDVFTTITGLELNKNIKEHKSLNDVLNNQ